MGFSRCAKTSAVFIDRAEYLGEESDGVSLLFLFSQRAVGVSALSRPFGRFLTFSFVAGAAK